MSIKAEAEALYGVLRYWTDRLPLPGRLIMLHTAEHATCPTLVEPDNYHFERICEDCDVRALVRSTLGQVEWRYQTGRIDQDQFEAFMFVWATSAPRFSSLADGWRTPPDPVFADTRRIVRKLLREAGRPVPGALWDCLPGRRTVRVYGGHLVDLDADESLPGDDTELFEPGYMS